MMLNWNDYNIPISAQAEFRISTSYQSDRNDEYEPIAWKLELVRINPELLISSPDDASPAFARHVRFHKHGGLLFFVVRQSRRMT